MYVAVRNFKNYQEKKYGCVLALQKIIENIMLCGDKFINDDLFHHFISFFSGIYIYRNLFCQDLLCLSF